jgi:hypothetical protein
MNAQEVDSELLEAAYWDIGIEYGFDAGLGGNIGYTNLGVDTGRFSHGSISFLYKDDGIDRWGKDYTGTIGYNQFPEEIVDEGYSYLTGSLLLGLKIAKEIHLLGVAGYKKATFIQKRFNESTILSPDGKYYSEFSDTDKDGIGAGLGVKFFLPLSNNVALTPTVQATTLKGISLSVGLAFN